jgi:hypothetical protein
MGFFCSSLNVYANSKPEVINPMIIPSPPLTEHDLIATYEVHDPDGDEIQEIEIKWYRDGVPLTNFNNQESIPSNATAKGEIWYYTIQAFDGTNYSDVNQSAFIEIENSAPNILELLPDINNIIMNETEEIDFYVQVEDPDGDLIMYNWTLNGYKISVDEYYTFETDFNSAGNYALDLSIQDVGEDSYILFYNWNISVLNVNRPPQVTIIEPLNITNVTDVPSQRFQIEVHDPDSDDTLNIVWYVDDLVVQTGGTSYTYTADPGARGVHEIRVEVDDGKQFAGFAWTVRVGDVDDDTNGNSLFSSDDVLIFALVFLVVVLVTIILVFITIFSIMKKGEK